MKKKILLLIIILMLPAWIACTHTNDVAQKTENKAKIADKIHTQGLQKEQTPSLASPLAPKVENIQSSKAFSKREKQIYSHAFEYVETDEMQNIATSQLHTEPLTAFKIKKDTFKNLEIGDSIVLPEIREYIYTLDIISKKTNANGSVTLKGQISGEDDRYYAIITEGDNHSFLTLHSNEGTYEMETKEGNGYVYASKEMRNKMINFSKTDEVILQSPKRSQNGSSF